MLPAKPSRPGPVFPAPLSAPLSLLPASLHSRLLAIVLNRTLAGQIQEGDLDFLQGRFVCVSVRDTGIRYELTFTGNYLAASPSGQTRDLLIEASLYDFMVLAGRHEDPDTLLFQRRLVMEGDTELGLEVKNFLDGLDAESLGAYGSIETLLGRAIPVYRRLFS